MTDFFDESYYLKHKAAQLAKDGVSDEQGKPYTPDTLKSALESLGMSAEDHYKAYGRGEKLNPNAYFNETEYLEAKKALLAETDPAWATKTVDELRTEIEKAGMTPVEHYEKFGAFEANSKGVLLNPSNAFDANAYFAAKLVELQAAGVAGASEMTVDEVVAVFRDAGLSPVTHYGVYGAAEAVATGHALVQTVPSEQRVPNDPARTENVPGNYNPPTLGALNDEATAGPVAKPADMGAKVPDYLSPTVVPPSKPLPVPGDSGYVSPPPGIVDTNAKPVVPPNSATGDNWAMVNPDGSANLIKPDGTPGGFLPEGSLTPDPSNPLPAPDPTPKPDPNPGGGGASYIVEHAVDPTNPTKIFINDAEATNPGKGIHLTGGDVANSSIFIAHTANGNESDALNATTNPAKNLNGVTIDADGVHAKEASIALQDTVLAAAQTLNLKLKDTTIGDVTTDALVTDGATGFHVVKNDGSSFSMGDADIDNYHYNVNLTNSGTSALQMSMANIAPEKMVIAGSGSLLLTNMVAQSFKETGGIVFEDSGFTGKLTMEVFANGETGGNTIELYYVDRLDELKLFNAGAIGWTTVNVKTDALYNETTKELLIDGRGFTGGQLEITGFTGNDIIYASNEGDTLAGYDGADRLFGGAGNDRIFGGFNYTYELYEKATDSGDASLARYTSSGMIQDSAFKEAISADSGYSGGFLNIYNGWLGDDQLFASLKADAFEYHTHVKTTEYNKDMDFSTPTFAEQGTDIIHNFELGNDMLLINMIELASNGIPKHAIGSTQGTGHGISRGTGYADILMATDIHKNNVVVGSAITAVANQVTVCVEKFIKPGHSGDDDYTVVFQFGDTGDTLTINFMDLKDANGAPVLYTTLDNPAGVQAIVSGLLVGDLSA